MVALDTNAVRRLVERGLKEYLTKQCLIPKELFGNVVRNIVTNASDRPTFVVPKAGRHEIVVWGNSLATIVDGTMRSGDWESPLNGEFYVVGGIGYVRFKKGQPTFRSFERPYEERIASVQLLVRPYEERVDVLSVGNARGAIVVPTVPEKNSFEVPEFK